MTLTKLYKLNSKQLINKINKMPPSFIWKWDIIQWIEEVIIEREIDFYLSNNNFKNKAKDYVGYLVNRDFWWILDKYWLYLNYKKNYKYLWLIWKLRFLQIKKELCKTKKD